MPDENLMGVFAPQTPAGVDEASVVGEGDELDVVGEPVVRAARSRVEAPDDHQPVDVAAELGEEEREGALGVEGASLAPVHVVRVDEQLHRRRRPTARASAASGGPNRRQPDRKPKPQERCMTAKITGSDAASPRPARGIASAEVPSTAAA